MGLPLGKCTKMATNQAYPAAPAPATPTFLTVFGEFMKSLYLPSCVALACALSLAACGGNKGNLILGGSVSGLNKSGLTLQNNGGPALAISAGASGFTFPELIGNDTDFNVTVKDMPAGAKCTIVNGKGKSAAYNVLTVEVRCITDTYTLGGTITGLDTEGLTIVNGSASQTIKAGATTFTMNKYAADGVTYVSGKVADGSPYGLTVLTQPAGRSCSIANGTGTMGSADRLDAVQITCI